MSSDDEASKSEEVQSLDLICRSEVPSLQSYSEYREYLRDDFYFSCAYCSLSECEAQGLAFEIDHYEPVTARPDLENDYQNLIYSCDECNSRKGDICPPPEVRQKGYEVFRPDRDVWEQHFDPSGFRLKHKSQIGEFSVEVLDLNRQSLQRLRGLRQRLHQADEFIARGILSLRKFRIDNLPPAIRAKANKAILQIPRAADQAAENIDDILKSAATSPLLDPDNEKKQRMKVRAEYIRSAQGLFPGNWRGRDYRK